MTTKIRPLSQALQEKTQRELNEIPNQVQEYLIIIRSWLEKQHHLKFERDDQHLLSLLRISKFSMQRIKDRIDTYCTFRTFVPEWTYNLDPHLPIMQKFLDLAVFIPLPLSEPTAPRVLLMHFRDYDTEELTLNIIIKGQVMAGLALLNNDDNFIISGVILVWDMKGLKFKTATQGTPTILRKLVFGLQSVLPGRLKGVHAINVPKFSEEFLNIMKIFMSKKLKNRIHVYSSRNMEEIFNQLPKSIFPQEYGGDAGHCEELRAEWKKKVEDNKKKLLDEDNIYSDESKRLSDSNNYESIFGVEGSFRNLNFD